MIHLKADFWEGLIFLGLCIVLFAAAKYIKDYLTPYKMDKELGAGENVAVAMSLIGYLIAVVIILWGAMAGPSSHLLEDIYSFLCYALLGIVLLNVARIINDKLLLRKFCNVKEIIEDKNAGAGVVEFGSYVASGLVIAGSIHGEGGGLHTALVFFFLSQVVFIAFTFIYDLMTPFHIHDEIEKDNVAAGVAFGGTLVALGVILFSGSVGNFISWKHNLSHFAVTVVISFIFLVMVRLLFDKILIPTIDLNHAISKKKNLAIGILEMTVVVSFAVILQFSMNLSISGFD